jgi:hypothetical protein
MLAFVSSECDHGQIRESFLSRRSGTREKAVAAAYFDPHADMLLAWMLDNTHNPYDSVIVASRLSAFDGDAGNAALERALGRDGSGTRDVRCAALFALAVRRRVLATPTLRSALSIRDGAVKDYAVIGLAGVGDDSAWDDVLAHFPALLRRKRHPEPDDRAMALGYLSQHLADAARTRELVTFVRKHWIALDQDQWFADYWPDARPDGPMIDAVAAPDATLIRKWVFDSQLLKPAGPPPVFG